MLPKTVLLRLETRTAAASGTASRGEAARLDSVPQQARAQSTARKRTREWLVRVQRAEVLGKSPTP